MADWQRTLDIAGEFKAAKNDEISMQQLAEIVAKKLQQMRPLGNSIVDSLKVGLVEDFDCIAAEPDATVEDFDEAMHELYNWADTALDGNWNGKKVCWVKTF